MPVILPRHPCPGCGELHDLCYSGPRHFSVNERYAFTCPATQRQVNFRPYRAGRFMDDCPAGAVAIRRVDPSRTPGILRRA
jgi:hypothetical protein